MLVTDETLTRDDIADALKFMNAHVKRQQHHPDCRAWVEGHARLDDLLTAYLAAQ